MKYHITTFGCQQNHADSERIASLYESRDYQEAQSFEDADTVIVNTCVIRERAAEKIFGFIRNVCKKKSSVHIVVTGCLIGAASREPSGKMMKALRKRLPDVEFLPLDEVGFEHAPKRGSGIHAWLPISNGCNNYCTYCIVPFSRGKERSRSFDEIIQEAQDILKKGFSEITLLGQNVNSYGADFLMERYKEGGDYVLDEENVKPIMVNHLGRHRIPTLFPHLLRRIADMNFDRVSFMSSNPWDFSDELIAVIAQHENIDRTLHLPVQSGSDRILKAMNRWYTREEYKTLVKKIRSRVSGVSFTTDIIVGFPSETQEEFLETMDFAREMCFEKGYIAYYSSRPGTKAASLHDDVSLEEKKRRFYELDQLVNKKKK